MKQKREVNLQKLLSEVKVKSNKLYVSFIMVTVGNYQPTVGTIIVDWVGMPSAEAEIMKLQRCVKIAVLKKFPETKALRSLSILSFHYLKS